VMKTTAGRLLWNRPTVCFSSGVSGGGGAATRLAVSGSGGGFTKATDWAGEKRMTRAERAERAREERWRRSEEGALTGSSPPASAALQTGGSLRAQELLRLARQRRGATKPVLLAVSIASTSKATLNLSQKNRALL